MRVVERFSETVWRRGWEGTKHGWADWRFIVLEAVISPAVGFAVATQSNNATLGFLAGIAVVVIGLASVWIGATGSAPIRQRNEARGEASSRKSELDALAAPCLRVVFEPVPPYQYVSRTHDPAMGEVSREFSIGIEDLCPRSIDGVRVQMVHMEGKTHDGRDVDDQNPFTLQVDNTGFARNQWDLREPFTVDPGPQGRRLVHIVQSNPGADPEAALNFFGAGSGPLPNGDYVFTIEVSGRDVVTVEGPKQFRVGVRDNQELTFEPINS